MVFTQRALIAMRMLVVICCVAIVTNREVTHALSIDSSIPAPTNVCAESAVSAVGLTWDAPTNERVTGHVVEFRMSGSDTWNEGPTVTSTSSVSVPGTNGTRYHYRVAAVDESGNRSKWGSYCVMGWGQSSQGTPPILGPLRLVPTQFTGGDLTGTSVVQVNDDCALTSDGLVVCGIGTSVPALVNDGDLAGREIVQLDGDCAVTKQAQVICGIQPGGDAPTLVIDGALTDKDVVQVSNSINHTCAVTTEGLLACWGGNLTGQLGTGNYNARAKPTLVMNGALIEKRVASVDAGPFATCAITTDGQLSCWGGNELLAIGETGDQASALPVVSNAGALYGKTITTVDVGESTACAATTDGDAICWGDQLNQPTPLIGGARENPTGRTPLFPTSEALSGKSVVDINVGRAQVCALTSDGTIVCWGDGQQGTCFFGDGTSFDMVTNWQSSLSASSGEALASASDMSFNEGYALLVWDGHATAGTAPSAVRNLTANAGAGKSIQVSWDPPVYEGPGDAVEYRIDYSTDGGHEWVQSATPISTTSGTLNVPQDGYYLVGVVARNNESESPRVIAIQEVLVKTETLTTKANIRFTIRTPNGQPLVGATAHWVTASGTQSSVGTVTTDSTGSGQFPLVATGPVEFLFENGRVGTSKIRVSARITVVVLRSVASLTLQTPPVPTTATRTVTAVMPDDTPVPDTQLTVLGGLWSDITTGFSTSLRDFTATWMYDGWPSNNRFRTNSDGQSTISGFVVPTIGTDVYGSFTDGFINQRVATRLTQPSNTLRFEQMPAISVIVDSETQYTAGQAVDVKVIATDGDGVPIENATITLQQIAGTATASVATRGGIRPEATCGQKLSGSTTGTGTVQLRICASTTATWRADGANLVPSRPVTIKVKSKPSAPTIKSIKSGNRALTVSFTAPKSNGGVAITNYQYSTDNGKTWRTCSPADKTSPLTITIRSGSTQRLSNGTTYSVKIRAVNAVGVGTASATKSGKPN